MKLDNEDKLRIYAGLHEALGCAIAITNDIVREFVKPHPYPFLNKHAWSFGFGLALTSFYYLVRPHGYNSRTEQIISVAVPSILYSAYEMASKSPKVFGAYDSGDIITFCIASLGAYFSIKTFNQLNNPAAGSTPKLESLEILVKKNST
jgi:hypothetical protein